jgi:predicted SprT family Zn-dependent metalloprotease
MKIPKSFQLLNRTITITYDTELIYASDNKGLSRYRFNDIVLQPASETCPISDIEQTFYHELTHWLLWFAGAMYKGKEEHCNMHRDEDFVDLLSCLLHQALSTMEYE